MSETQINEAGWDRAVRLLILPAVIAGWYFGYLPIWAAVPLGVLGLMFGKTGVDGVCPIYTKMGISTK